MGKAYEPAQRVRVKELLEAGTHEEEIEKETGVSDRTIRRWKLELERTGRIGKPPESRTGRHRVLTPEVEAALFDYVKDKPDMSVDDMLWWLHETYGVVVGTRTIRRVFERKGDANNRFKKNRPSAVNMPLEDNAGDNANDAMLVTPDAARMDDHFRVPFTPLQNNSTEMQLVQALGHSVYPPPPTHQEIMAEAPEDEETIQLELEQIALARREVELKLKMKRLQQNKSPHTPASTRKPDTPDTGLSSLYIPGSDPGPPQPKRDSRSKKKIEESKRRTEERRERMLADLHRRSRRREHLTADWVQSKDIWPLRAQALLADLMHRYNCYSYSTHNIDAFEAMYHDLYQLVDHGKNDWNPAVHDDLLRERMKRKMSQLRSKMQKTGEIIGRGDTFGTAWTKADDYTGQQVRDMDLDETDPDLQAHSLQSQAAALGNQQHNGDLHFEQDPTAAMQHAQLPYGAPPMLHHTSTSQYPLIDDSHGAMLPYGQMSQQQGMPHSSNLTL